MNPKAPRPTVSFVAFVVLAWTFLVPTASAEDKPTAIQEGKTSVVPTKEPFARPSTDHGSGHRILMGDASAQVPVVVVRGTPYEMGFYLGRLTGEEIRRFVPATLEGVTKKLGVSQETLREVWARSTGC